MSPRPSHKEPPKPPKGKGKGARRVSNLSEEQRNKKRENDRIAQQNIRRRNKELIEKLQQEVEFLSKLDRIEVVKRLMRRNKDLEDEVHALRKALFLHTGRPHPVSGFDVDGLPASGHPGDYVPHSFGSPFLAAANPYDQWPSSVVPVPSTATVHSVESSPGASGPGEDFTPAYVHTSVPMMDGPAMTSSTSAPSSIASAKVDYQELDAGPSPTSGYSSHSGQPSSSAYLQEQQPWPIYQPGTYYSHATAL
ncbi:hypothetical protein C8A05DRAFT_11535 [Staphylotrichum tortipilum]|uniref:BZIP domain-containing protein n=1 Tax=Staphylotrichum tortipilum TaxID=2831512 RepID=A0AAN6MT99_9PEZI|nr:hypothetical protein C8A05DRAFT_11535 [Staphylotrichum longicolle]